MSIKILTKNSIDNTNIDGARENHFSAGMKSGIVKGSLNEGRFFASASNIIALDTCVLLISGHPVVIDSVEYITLSNKPATPTRYSMIAEITVNDNSEPAFRLFVQPTQTVLIQQNLFNTKTGAGTYQIKIGNFTLDTNGEIQEVNRIVDVISGGGDGAIADIEFNASAEIISSDLQPEVNVDYNEETKQYDIDFKIPSGSGSNVLIGGVKQPTWSADFAESERIKSKNLLYIPDYVRTIEGITSSAKNGRISISGTSTTSWAMDTKINGNTEILFEQGKTYTLSLQNIEGNDYCAVLITGIARSNNTNIYNFMAVEPSAPIQTITAPVDVYVNRITLYWAENAVIQGTSFDVQLEEGATATEYTMYKGEIVHNGDKVGLFADSERLKSRNILPIMDRTETFGNLTLSSNSATNIIKIEGTSSNLTQGFYFHGRTELGDTILKAGHTYTFGCKYVYGASATTNVGLLTGGVRKVSDGTYLSDYFYVYMDRGNQITRMTFTPTEDVIIDHVMVYFYQNSDYFNTSVRVALVEDNKITAVDFQPYNGDVVHKKQITPVLLWKNETPSSSILYQQNVSVRDMSPYKYLLVLWKTNKDDGVNRYTKGIVGQNIDLEFLDGTFMGGKRTIYYNDSRTITIGNAFAIGGIDDPQQEDRFMLNSCIPVEIYGVQF